MLVQRVYGEKFNISSGLSRLGLFAALVIAAPHGVQARLQADLGSDEADVRARLQRAKAGLERLDGAPPQKDGSSGD